MDVVGLLLFSLVYLGVAGLGIYAFVATVLKRSRGVRSKLWPVAEGIVSSTGIREEYDQYSDYTSGTHYYPEIHYSYEFRGAEYTSSRVSFEGVQSYSDRREAEDWLPRYPKGTRIRVYCNPEKPEESVLEPGFRARELITGLCGSLLMVAIPMTVFFLLAVPEMSKVDWLGVIEQIAHGITNWLKSWWLSHSP